MWNDDSADENLPFAAAGDWKIKKRGRRKTDQHATKAIEEGRKEANDVYRFHGKSGWMQQ